MTANNQGQQYIPGESIMEEESKVPADGGQPVMESYQPSASDTDLPYIPTLGGRPAQQQQGVPIQQGFVDMNNLDQYSNQGQSQQPQQPQYNQQANQAAMAVGGPVYPQTSGPNLENAGANLAAMSGSMDQFNKVDPNVTSVNGTADEPTLQVAIKRLRDAEATLSEVADWIPIKNSSLAPQFTKIAKPIKDALGAYIEKISTLN